MDTSRTLVTKSAAETQKFGKAFGRALLEEGERSHAQIICLWGELGSGKTTFVQGIATGLGISSRLLSPTFIIVRRYNIPVSKKQLYHVDLYRIAGPIIDDLGLSEVFGDPNAICIIEWPERLGKSILHDRTDIHFSTMRNGCHQIEIEIHHD